MTADQPAAPPPLPRARLISDEALEALNVSDRFDALLSRVRDALGVDTAAVMVLDTHARQLVATAAKGLEDEVWEGFRVTVGEGFAGRVAQTRQPLAITDVTPRDVVSPLLLRKGIRSLLGVPMLADGSLVGVIHVGSVTRREFTGEDVALLQLAASQVSGAGRVRANSLEQAAALALQRSLLPSQLPPVPGLDLAARYVPGHDLGIGGDWYDVFPLPSGWTGVVIGDVSGHGLRSAVVMGRIRSALRAYALVCDDPAEALTLLDRKIHHFEAGTLTTALYATVSPDRGAVRISLAGHLRPILAPVDGPASIPELPVDPPLGMGAARLPKRRTTTLELPPAATLVCFTDGLVERRGELIDIGLDRVRAAIQPAPADELCATLMLTTGLERPTDDVALMVLRRCDPAPAAPQPTRLLSARFALAELSAVRHEVEAISSRCGLSGPALEDWVTAVNELMVNAVRHGGGTGAVRVQHGERLVCEVSDSGAGFAATPYLTRADRPSVSPTGGMGLWVVRQMADLLGIDSGPDGTTVRIAARPGDAPAG